MGKTKFINLDYLENMTGGSKELVKELADIFISQIPEFITEMKQLLSEKKYESLGMLAHKAKSSVAIMGMEELAKDLKEFESFTREKKNIDQYSSYIEKFETSCNNAISELKSIITDL